MAKSLKEIMGSRSENSKKQIEEFKIEMVIEMQLYELRTQLEYSQQKLAKAMGLTQPTVAAIERKSNDPKLSTIKRYVEAMGGKLRIDVELSDGKHIGLNI